MRKTACSVCLRPDVDRIDAARAAGAGLRAVAREFGLAKSTLVRHEQHGGSELGEGKMPPPTSALVMADVPEGLPSHPAAVALRELVELHGQALESYAGAVRDGDRRNVATLLLQLRRDLEMRARLEAQLRPDERPPAERLASNPEWLAFQRVLLPLLDRHPEIKAEIIGALEAYVSQESPSS